jgi:hypothetical protein
MPTSFVANIASLLPTAGKSRPLSEFEQARLSFLEGRLKDDVIGFLDEPRFEQEYDRLLAKVEGSIGG